MTNARRQPRYSKGQRIANRYLVHQALSGGMGEVYLCLDEEENYPYALKTFQGGEPSLHDLFKHEVAHWVALEKHPNIVRCFYMKTLDKLPFMMLEWVAGEEGKGTDLRSWLRHGALDLTLALRFSIDIVRGLHHAQVKSPGIVHRDLKPGNVLVNQSWQAKITDFGLATVMQATKPETNAAGAERDVGQSMHIGNIVGTPEYMSPEQWRGEPDIDFRADMYAFGCILYELLTGSRLYDGHTVSALRRQHLSAPIPSLNGVFPPGIKHILEGCLAKDQRDRFAQLDDLLEALRQVYEGHSGDRLAEVSGEAFSAIDYVDRCGTFANLGQHERALEDCDIALRLDPTLSEAYYNRGVSYAALGQHERALTEYDAALRLDPTLAKAYSNRGVSYHNLEQFKRASADYDAAIRLDSTLAQAYLNRGNSYVALEQYERALEDYDAALRLDPTYTKAYYNRGTSYTALGQHQQAIADYDAAIRLDPNFAIAYYNRGTSYTALGQHQQAIADYDDAIRLDPTFAQAYFNKGVTLANNGGLREALYWFEQAHALGARKATGAIQKARQMLGLPPTPAQSNPNDP